MARRQQKISPKTSGYAIVGDGPTEQWYVELFRRHYNLKVKTEPKLPKGKLQEQYEYVISLSNVYDKVIWIIDLDQILKENRDSTTSGKLNEFKKYYKKAIKDDIVIIVNNPCLEYWYLLHNTPNTTKYYQSYDHLKDDLNKFKIDKNIFEKYTKSKSDYKDGCGLFEKLHPYLKKIDFNKLKGFDIDKCESESCSEMYKLFDIFGIKNI